MSHRGENGVANTLQIFDGTTWVALSELVITTSAPDITFTVAGIFNVIAPTTSFSGNVLVNGSTIQIDAEVLVADAYINLNNGYTVNGVPRPSGLVVNLEPQTAPTSISGAAFASATTLNAAGATLSAGDFFMVADADLPRTTDFFRYSPTLIHSSRSIRRVKISRLRNSLRTRPLPVPFLRCWYLHFVRAPQVFGRRL